MTLKTAILAASAIGLVCASTASAADTATKKKKPAETVTETAAQPVATQAQIDALNKQIQALQTQIQALQTQNADTAKTAEAAKVAAATAAKAADTATAAATSPLSFPNGLPVFTSSDGAFTFAPVGRIHLDYGYNLQSTRAVPTTAGGAIDPRGANAKLPTGFNFRRAYLGFAGKMFNDFTYDVEADFAGRSGGTNSSAPVYVPANPTTATTGTAGTTGATGRLQTAQLSYIGLPGWQFDVGEMQPAFTFEDSISSNNIGLLERPAITNIVTSQIASEGRLSAGARAFGSNYFFDAYLTGQSMTGVTQVATSTSGLPIGSSTGPVSTVATTNPGQLPNASDQHAVFVRGAYRPINTAETIVHIGADFGELYSPAHESGVAANQGSLYSLSERPENRYGGLGSIINTGGINIAGERIYGGELAVSHENFWAQAEDYQIELTRRNARWLTGANTPTNNPSFSGYYVSTGWIITGQHRGYVGNQGAFGPVPVTAPFAPSKGQWGSWEAVFRYSVADLNYAQNDPLAANRVRGGYQEVYTMGLNWYVTPNVRAMVDYQFIDIKKLGTITGVAGTVNVGDSWQTLGGRVQFVF